MKRLVFGGYERDSGRESVVEKVVEKVWYSGVKIRVVEKVCIGNE